MNSNGKFEKFQGILVCIGVGGLHSIVMMGGTMLFSDERVHQILGMTLLALWICHVIFHRRWFGSLFKGKFPPFRIIQLVVNLAISVFALLLMISGLMMAWFMPVSLGLDFARRAHLVSSHWYYVLMSMHIGLHLQMIFSRMFQKEKSHSELVSKSSVDEMQKQVRHEKLVLRIIIALISLYGLYAFIARGVWKYMFLLQPFFFFDFERGYVLFAVDYIAMLVLFAVISHYAEKLFKKN